MGMSAVLVTLAVLTQAQQHSHYTPVIRSELRERVRVQATFLLEHHEPARPPSDYQTWAPGMSVSGSFKFAPRVGIGGEASFMKPFRELQFRQVGHFAPPTPVTQFRDTAVFALLGRVHSRFIDALVGPALAHEHTRDSHQRMTTFTASRFCFVLGADGRLPITRHIAVSPAFRAYLFNQEEFSIDPAGIYRIGVGLSTTFW